MRAGRSPGIHADTIAALDQITGTPSAEAQTLYRGVGSAALASFQAQGLGRGGIVRDAGFVSTTTDREVAKSFMTGNAVMMRIKAPAGSRLADISALSDNPGERETLIARGSAFKVVSYTSKSRTLKVRLVSE